MTTGRHQLIIILLILAVYGQATSFSFLVYDDPININKNPAITAPSLQKLAALWEKPHEHLYIPVTYSAWMGIASISNLIYGKLNPGLFHFANILLHLINTLLVYAILVRLLGYFQTDQKASTSIAALLGALVFALHPVQVEPVCWATGFKDLLSAFFLLLATYILLLAHHPTKSKKAQTVTELILVTGIYLLAILAKPQAVIFPLIIYTLIRFVLHARPSPKLMLFMGLWLCMGVTIALLTKNVQPNPFHVSPFQRIHIATDAALFYLAKIIFPYPLLIDYGKSLAVELSNPFLWIYPATALLIAIMIYSLRHGKRVLACTVLILISVSPVLGLLPFNFQRISIVADRYLYVAVFFFSLGFAICIKKSFSPTTVWITIIIICGYGLLSFQYGSKWRDSTTLMQYTLKKNPTSKIANQDLGVALMRKGKMKEAIPYLQKAAELVPTDMTTHFNLALSYACIGDTRTAQKEKKIILHNAPALGKKLSIILPRITNTCLKKDPHHTPHLSPASK